MALRLVGEAAPNPPSYDESLESKPKDRAITRRFLARLAVGCLMAGGTLTGVLLGVGDYFTDRAEEKADETIAAVQELKTQAEDLESTVKGAQADLGSGLDGASDQATDLNKRACALLEDLGAEGPGFEGCIELLYPSDEIASTTTLPENP